MKNLLVTSILVATLFGAGVWYWLHQIPRNVVENQPQNIQLENGWLSECKTLSNCKQVDLGKMIAGLEYSIDLGKDIVLLFSFKEETDNSQEIIFNYKVKGDFGFVPIHFPIWSSESQTILFTDFNFDGYLDIVGPAGSDTTGASPQSLVYMYYSANTAFVEDPVLKLFSEKTDLFNKEQKTIERHFTYADYFNDSTYQFINSKWILIKETSVGSEE